MTYTFQVRDVVAEPYQVAPQLTARLRVEESTGRRIHAVVLRCQVRVEPGRRRYDAVEGEALRGLFGDRARWVDTLKPFAWMQCHTTVQGFTGATDADLALPCTYDLDVIGTRYLHALTAGTVPLTFLFSGTVFTRGANGFGVEHVPWDCEARYDLPVTTWRAMIEEHFPNTGWIRVERAVLDDLAALRARAGHLSWDETIRSLLPVEVVA